MTFETVQGLIAWLFLGPVCAICGTVVVRWMIMGDIEVWVGLVALAGNILTLVIAIKSEETIVQIFALTGMVTLMAFFPFASDYIARQDLRTLTAEHIGRGHSELSVHPENFPAWFTLARNLYEFGYRGHAIALAEQTLERIPNVPDPIKNCSVRDLFRAEESEIKKWRRDSTNPKYHRPLVCPKCRAANEPGLVNCRRCGGPYLLELSRRAPGKAKVFAKLVLGWSVIAILVPASSLAAISYSGFLGFAAIAGAVGLCGIILYFVFRPPGGTSSLPTPFS